MLTAPYKAKHEENRMRHEGDVDHARELFFLSRNNNLNFLLRNRFLWMNQFIQTNDKGIEVGCGTGISKEFIRSSNYRVTDYSNKPWLDIPHVDALNTPFGDSELDFVISSNMIHHVPYPRRFFGEMARIIKSQGYLLVQEINPSFMMRVLLRVMRHEGYSLESDVFDPNYICTDPEDLWSANCAIPALLFDDEKRFHEQIPEFRIVRQSYSEFFNFMNSGGVIAKTFYIPLPTWALKAVKAIDDLLAQSFPRIFALQRQIVLRRV